MMASVRGSNARSDDASILVTGGTVVTMNPDREVYLDGAIAIGQTEILEVGRRADVESRWSAPTVIDAEGSLVIPSLINSHTHSFQVLFRGMGDDLPVIEWARRIIWPLTGELGPEESAAGARLASLEMIKGWISGFADSLYLNKDPELILGMAEAIRDSGLRGRLARACVDTGEAPDHIKEETGVAIDTTRELITEWDRRNDDRVRLCAEALFVIAATPDLIHGLHEVARETGTRFHTHAGESIVEATETRKATGKSIFEFYESVGGLGPDVLAAHAVWTTAGDIDILARTGTTVAHNPVSNQYLASGIPPIRQMLDKGVTVGLGTDGAASNNTQNLFECLKAASLLQKVSLLDARALTAEEALEMATLGGAATLGLSEQTGSLEPGKRADVTIVSLQNPHTTPPLKPVSNLVYCSQASDVQTLIVDGQILMRDRQVLTLDEGEVLAHAREVGARVAGTRYSPDEYVQTGRFSYLR
jgi:5-methylthioadenosine/S-adenosylhomocysteine deaminase